MIKIRRGSHTDAAALAAFGSQIFEETFGADNQPENMTAYLASTYGVRQQAEELNNPDVITVLAETDERIVGFAQVRLHPPPDCVTEEASVELWRFYVDRTWQGRGVAQRLMKAVHNAAGELGGRKIWLSVWEQNPRAIAFYGKSGFTDVGTKDFWVGSDKQTDRVMVADVITA